LWRLYNLLVFIPSVLYLHVEMADSMQDLCGCMVPDDCHSLIT